MSGPAQQARYRRSKWARGQCANGGCHDPIEVNPRTGRMYLLCRECRRVRNIKRVLQRGERRAA